MHAASRIITGFALLIAATTCALAANDIVYVARYYNQPGAPGHSYNQIYTIDPDGNHRRQLTFETTDDLNRPRPTWSPDGKHILYVTRASAAFNGGEVRIMDEYGRGNRLICESPELISVDWEQSSTRIDVDASVPNQQHMTRESVYDLNGRRLSTKVVRESNGQSDSRPITSADGKYTFDTKSGRIVNVITGQTTGATKTTFTVATWDDHDILTAVGPATPDGHVHEIAQFDITARAVRSFSSPWINKTGSWMGDGDADWMSIEALKSVGGAYIGYQDWAHDSGGDIGMFIIQPVKSRYTYMAEGQFTALSPDERRVCTAKWNDVANYSRRGDGTWRQVWVAPLEIVDVPSGKCRVIQGGLVWATAADWRGGHSGGY